MHMKSSLAEYGSLKLHPADEHIVFLNTLRNKAGDTFRGILGIFDLAFYTRRTECEDQRDHIYALYALVPTQRYGMGASRLTPDYHVDVIELCLHLIRYIQVSDVFEDITKNFMINNLVAGLRLTWRQRLRLVQLGRQGGLRLTSLEPILFRTLNCSLFFFGGKFIFLEIIMVARKRFLSGRRVHAPPTDGSELQSSLQGERTAPAFHIVAPMMSNLGPTRLTDDVVNG